MNVSAFCSWIGGYLPGSRGAKKKVEQSVLSKISVGLSTDLQGEQADYLAKRVAVCLAASGVEVIPMATYAGMSGWEAGNAPYKGVDGTIICAALILAGRCRSGTKEDYTGFARPRPAWVIEGIARFCGSGLQDQWDYEEISRQVRRKDERHLRVALDRLAEDVAAAFIAAYGAHTPVSPKEPAHSAG